MWDSSWIRFRFCCKYHYLHVLIWKLVWPPKTFINMNDLRNAPSWIFFFSSYFQLLRTCMSIFSIISMLSVCSTQIWYGFVKEVKGLKINVFIRWFLIFRSLAEWYSNHFFFLLTNWSHSLSWYFCRIRSQSMNYLWEPFANSKTSFFRIMVVQAALMKSKYIKYEYTY